jgi:hypothetical protein
LNCVSPQAANKPDAKRLTVPSAAPEKAVEHLVVERFDWKSVHEPFRPTFSSMSNTRITDFFPSPAWRADHVPSMATTMDTTALEFRLVDYPITNTPVYTTSELLDFPPAPKETAAVCPYCSRVLSRETCKDKKAWM